MADKHQVLALLKQGLTCAEVAKRLGCRREYVNATAHRNFVTFTRARRGASPFTIDEWAHGVLGRMDSNQIAAIKRALV